MKLVAPRPPTPVTPAPGRSGSHLPTDIVADQVERLRLFSVVSGGLWAVGLFMDTVIGPRLVGLPISTAAILVEVTAILAAAGV
jgi:hypothetical protein